MINLIRNIETAILLPIIIIKIYEMSLSFKRTFNARGTPINPRRTVRALEQY